MRRSLLFSLSLLPLAGCVTGPSLRDRMAAYIGADMQTLVQQLGVPNKQITVNGIKYAAYDEQSQVVVPGGYWGGWYGPNWVYGGGYYPYTPSVIAYSCETTFMLKDGRVVNFTLRGNDCN